MHKFLIMLPVVMSIIFFQVSGRAEDANKCMPPEDLSSLSGVWADKNAIRVTKKGPGKSHQVFDLVFDRIGTVTGVKSWERQDKSPGNHGYDAAGNKTYKDSEEVIGLFDKSECSLVLVETTSEEGVFQGRLIGNDRIKFIFTQTGELDAMVVRGILVRTR